jgi:uncharacterized membrane protein
MDLPLLLIKTIWLRPYVFLFLIAFLCSAGRLLGWTRTALFFLITWITAFLCEFSSTRTGFPFGRYFYTGTTVGQELYLFNVPFMDSLSFTFLLYASYCLALLFLLPASSIDGGMRLRFDLDARTSWSVLWLTALLYALIDVVIDPVALRGDRWFLGKIYDYATPGIYFGVPIENFLGWAVVGFIALSLYFRADRRLASRDSGSQPINSDATGKLLEGCGLYYAVLIFNLSMTFWIDEPLLGLAGVLIYLPITVLAVLRVIGRLPHGGFSTTVVS